MKVGQSFSFSVCQFVFEYVRTSLLLKYAATDSLKYLFRPVYFKWGKDANYFGEIGRRNPIGQTIALKEGSLEGKEVLSSCFSVL